MGSAGGYRWMNYYGHFQRSALMPRWLERVRARQPLLFSHWVPEGRQNNRSRMKGDVHVRI